MFDGQINPGQLQIVREITTDTTRVATSTPPSSRATAREYAFSATADGQVIVTACDRGLARRHRSAAQHREGAVRRRQRAQHHRRHARATTSAERHGAGRPDPRPCRRRHAQRLARQRHPRRRRRRHYGDVDGSTMPTTSTTTASAIPPAQPTGVRIGRRATTAAAPTSGQIQHRRRHRTSASLQRAAIDGAQIQRTVNLAGATTATDLFRSPKPDSMLARRRQRHGLLLADGIDTSFRSTDQQRRPTRQPQLSI